MASNDADFSPLGDMEIDSAGAIFKQCEFLRDRASNAGLIIVQWANDVEWALASVPVLDQGRMGMDSPQRRARRVARHAYRSAEAMRAVAESAAKLPPAYLKAYQDVIQRRKKRPSFDPREGI